MNTAQPTAGRLLTADKLDAHNTFENPNALQPMMFNEFKLAQTTLTVKLPAKSVVTLELA